MKKIVMGILTGLLLTGMLTGCSLTPVKIQEGSAEESFSDMNVSGKESGTGHSQDAEGTVLYVAKLPKQYFITYEVSDKDGVVTTFSKAVDVNGNIYYKADEEYLFMRDGEIFSLYQRDGEQFTQQTDKKYQAGYVENLTKEFEEYVKRANLNTGGIAKFIEEGEVAGRKCNVYEIAVKVVNFEQIYRFAVDQDTYICLNWESEKNISGFEETGEGSFTCTRFETEGVDLEKEFLNGGIAN